MGYNRKAFAEPYQAYRITENLVSDTGAASQVKDKDVLEIVKRLRALIFLPAHNSGTVIPAMRCWPWWWRGSSMSFARYMSENIFSL